MEKLKNSLKTFGHAHPLICNSDFTIIGGHQTYNAARELGWKKIKVNIPSLPLALKEEQALNLALNKISGEWDILKLDEILRSLDAESINLSGFDTPLKIESIGVIPVDISLPAEGVEKYLFEVYLTRPEYNLLKRLSNSRELHEFFLSLLQCFEEHNPREHKPEL